MKTNSYGRAASPSDGRVKAFPVTPKLLLNMLITGSFFLVEKGIPADAEYVGAGYCLETNRFKLFIRHESFPVTAVGVRYPDLEDVRVQHYSDVDRDRMTSYLNTLSRLED